MAVELFEALTRMFARLGGWFEELIFYTGFQNYYYTAIFVAMTTGFLLKRFGSALSLGSDKAVQYFKRKGDE